MLRLTEAGLFALPLLAFLVWRLSGARGGLPPHVLAAAALTFVLLALALVWFGFGRALPPDAPYVPARIGAEGQMIGPDSQR